MNRISTKILLVAPLSLFALCAAEIAFATGNHAFEEDFEDFLSKPVQAPRPKYQLPAPFEDNFGPGRLFEITDAASHSGTHSMRFNYNGHNGFCNICGAKPYKQKSGLGAVDYFVESTGIDLTANEDPATPKEGDGPRAILGKVVYNKSNGYSLWEIVSIDTDTAKNDKLTLKLLKPGTGGETPGFYDDDNVSIARMCGLDGTVGINTPYRRSDCDTGISWFNKISDFPQSPGVPFYRRVYLKAEIASEVISSKLRYWTFPDAISNVLLAKSTKTSGRLEPEFTGIKKYDASGGSTALNLYYPSNGLDPNLEFERGVWYYIEEKFLPESAPGANNGEYKLWFAKAGAEPSAETDTPTLVITDLALPVVDKTSFWGNTQHDTHSVGVWYIDDIVISDAWHGAVIAPNNDIPPPEKTAKPE